MLQIIFMIFVFSICSTAFVRPFFWKRLKNKTLSNNDDGEIGFTKMSFSQIIGGEIVIFFVIAILNSAIYFGGIVKHNFYTFCVSIFVCVICQQIIDNQETIKRVVLLIIAVICAVILIQDYAAGESVSIPLNKMETVPISTSLNNGTVKTFVSADDIASLFKATSAKGPTYNNGKYVFELSGGENDGDVVIIDKDNCEEAKLIDTDYKFEINLHCRLKCPSKKLQEMYIVISDDGKEPIPYGIYAVAEKSWLFGTYKAEKYLLLNMKNGEMEEYSQEELPDFVLGK